VHCRHWLKLKALRRADCPECTYSRQKPTTSVANESSRDKLALDYQLPPIARAILTDEKPQQNDAPGRKRAATRHAWPWKWPATLA
jgi:hypothetical protein